MVLSPIIRTCSCFPFLSPHDMGYFEMWDTKAVLFNLVHFVFTFKATSLIAVAWCLYGFIGRFGSPWAFFSLVVSVDLFAVYSESFLLFVHIWDSCLTSNHLNVYAFRKEGIWYGLSPHDMGFLGCIYYRAKIYVMNPCSRFSVWNQNLLSCKIMNTLNTHSLPLFFLFLNFAFISITKDVSKTILMHTTRGIQFACP